MITGSVQTKGRKYYAVLRIPDREGKVRQKWIALNLPERGNKGEAKQRLAELLADYNRGHVVYSPEIGFAEYLTQWLKDIKPQLALSTWETYEVDLRRHIVPYFREHPCKLSRLTTAALQRYCNEKSESGKVHGKGGLAPKTIKNHHGIIHKALQDAMDHNILFRNPATKLNLPKKAQRTIEAYTREQANTLIAAARDTDLYIPVLLALHGGLRRGEILGLQWGSVNFENGTIIVQDTVTRQSTLVIRRGTKSESGYRTLKLTDAVMDVLRQCKERQGEAKAFLGSGYIDNDLVYARANGEHMNPGTFTKRMQVLMEKAGLPVINPHGLRHTNATLLQDFGADLADLSRWMGHSEISTTEIYLHLNYRSTEKMAALCAAHLTV